MTILAQTFSGLNRGATATTTAARPSGRDRPERQPSPKRARSNGGITGLDGAGPTDDTNHRTHSTVPARLPRQ
jgi:hypothetical protein